MSVSKDSIINYAALMLIVLLPFVTFKSRLLPSDGQIIGLLLAGFVSSFVASWHSRFSGDIPDSIKWLILMWVVAGGLSVVGSLSPIPSLVGDAYRRMGWLSQCLIAGTAMVIGSRLSASNLSKLAWYSGVLVGGFVVLEWLFTIYESVVFFDTFSILPHRMKGPFLSEMRTAAWLMSCLIWASYKKVDLPFFPVRTYQTGCLLMVLALCLTGTRSSLIGLVGALVTGGIYAWHHMPQRRFKIFSGFAGIILLAGLISISQTVPILSRFTLMNTDDMETIQFRLQLWSNIGTFYMSPSTALPAGLQQLIIGYGQENFEVIHRIASNQNQLPLSENLRIDRAHNHLFDMLVMQGISGLLIQLSLWLLPLYMAFRRLKFNIFMFTATFAAIAFAVSMIMPVHLWPLLITGSLCLLVFFWLALRGRSKTDEKHLIYVFIAFLVAHMIDLQFSIQTPASAWWFWLSLVVFACHITSSNFPQKDQLAIHPISPLLTTWVVYISLTLFLIVAFIPVCIYFVILANRYYAGQDRKRIQKIMLYGLSGLIITLIEEPIFSFILLWFITILDVLMAGLFRYRVASLCVGSILLIWGFYSTGSITIKSNLEGRPIPFLFRYEYEHLRWPGYLQPFNYRYHVLIAHRIQRNAFRAENSSTESFLN